MSLLRWLLLEKPPEPKIAPIAKVCQVEFNKKRREAVDLYCKQWIIDNSDKYQIVATTSSGKTIYGEIITSSAHSDVRTSYDPWNFTQEELWYPVITLAKQNAENFIHYTSHQQFIQLDGKLYNTKNIECLEIVKVKE